MIIIFSIISAYKLYGALTAVLVGLFITLSGSLINNVPGTTNAHLMPLVLSIYLLFLINHLRGSGRSIYIALFVAASGVQFQGVFAVPLVIFTLLVSILTSKFLLNAKRVIIAIISTLIPLGTFVLFDIRHDFLISKGVINLLFDSKGLGVIDGYEKYGDFLYRLYDRFRLLISLPDNIQINPSKLVYLLLVTSLIYAFLKLYKDRKNNPKFKELVVLLSLPAFIYTIFLYFKYPVWEHYIFAIPVVTSFIFALSMKTISENIIGKIIVILTVILMTNPAINQLKYSYLASTYERSTSDGSYLNQLEVVDYIFTSDKSKSFGYFVYSPQIFTYGMDYLMWWRGKYLYGYEPVSQKSDTFYLIMYPPLIGDEGAHEFWQKNVLRTTSEVSGRKEFRGKIILEKRVKSEEEPPVDTNYYMNIR